ncbi:30S ribosomal protein S7 [Patescibacteria group bacterium]|nr:30S ribosomal protein S7 [Patescibacteria group bacterium]
MRGKKQAIKRVIEPDPKYGSVVLAKFINHLMERGKKTVARKIMYEALAEMEKKTKQPPLDLFDEAMKNVSPQVEVKSRRVGGANYQVPIEVRGDRKQTLAMRWIITATRAKKGRPTHLKLAEELMAAANNEGDAIKKKQDVHRMAEANRAFAHFA